MSLSCECDTDGEGWYYYSPENYTTLQTKRRKRCCSCKELIGIGTTGVEFVCTTPPRTEVEEKIYGGDDIQLASKYMCEECGDLYFSLNELGFCIYLEGNSMQELLKEYHEVYGNG